jgi:hypothetical protein
MGFWQWCDVVMLVVEGSSNVYETTAVGAGQRPVTTAAAQASASFGLLASATRKRTGDWIPCERIFRLTKTLTYAAGSACLKIITWSVWGVLVHMCYNVTVSSHALVYIRICN